MKTFKHKVIAGRYKTFDAFSDAFTNHITDWRNAKATSSNIGSVESFLGLTYSEYSQLIGNLKDSFNSYATGSFLVIPSVPHLDYMLSHYKTNPVNKIIRFGQYVFNESGFEFENSYNEKEIEQAYDLLKKGIEYWSKEEE